MAKQLVTREIVKVLKPFHAQELSAAPYNTWPLLRSKQTQEIIAVRAGKLNLTDRIVDRRTWANPYLPEAVHRLQQPILKATPYNIRRFSETPIPRKAINLIKNAIVALPWKVTAMEDIEVTPDLENRRKIATRNLKRPNNTDSWRTLMEAVVEDVIIGGFGTIEQRLTPHFERPFKLWAVDGSTIRIYPNWTESQPDMAHYAQMTGLKGERDHIDLRDDQIIYIRDNIRTNTPFGLGKLEVSFQAINAFLGAQDFSSKAGANQVTKTWMWWKNPLPPGQVSTVERHLRNEEEGQAKISLIAGIEKPEVIDVKGFTSQDLLIEWQEFCIRIISQGFDLSPMALGLERDVNRSTGEVMATADFKAAVVPIARKVEESLTRWLLHRLLKWKDLEFKFIGLEDPDLLTKINIFTQLYAVDGINSDEIREDLGRTKDPSGRGRLFNSDKALQQIEAQAKVTGDQQKAAQAAMPGSPMRGPGGGASKAATPAALPKAPKITDIAPGAKKALKAMIASTGPMRGSVFNVVTVLGMTKKQLIAAKAAGFIPKDSKTLKKSMDEQVPGILEYISKQTRDYFDYLEKEEDELKVNPSETTVEEEKEQVAKFKEHEVEDNKTPQAEKEAKTREELRKKQLEQQKLRDKK